MATRPSGCDTHHLKLLMRYRVYTPSYIKIIFLFLLYFEFIDERGVYLSSQNAGLILPYLPCAGARLCVV